MMNIFGARRTPAPAVSGPFGAGATTLIGGTPVSQAQAKKVLDHVGSILDGKVSPDIKEKLGASIKSVDSKLNEFRSKPPESLKEFETQTKALQALFETAEAHIHTVIKASDSVDPHEIRAAEKLVFYTLKAEFNAEKQKRGGGLVLKEMGIIGGKLAILPPNTGLQEFLNVAIDCSKQTADLERAINSIGLEKTHSVDSLKTQLRAKFDGQLDALDRSTMDVTKIAMTADQVHGLICGDPDLKAILTPPQGKSVEPWLDKFKTEMTGQFNTKAEAMKGEIDRKLTSSDVVGASRLLQQLETAVNMATGSIHEVVGETASGSVRKDPTFPDISGAAKALEGSKLAVASDKLHTALDKEAENLSDPRKVHQAVLDNPASFAEELRARLNGLDQLERAAEPSSVSSTPRAPSSAGSTLAVFKWSTRDGSMSLDDIREELTGILGLADQLATVQTVFGKARDIGERYTSLVAPVTLKEVNEAIGNLGIQVGTASNSRSRSGSIGSEGSVSSAIVTVSSQSLLEGTLLDRVGSGSEGEVHLEQLGQIKADLEAAESVDRQASELSSAGPRPASVQDRMASVLNQLNSDDHASRVDPREKVAKGLLVTAQKSVVNEAMAKLEKDLHIEPGKKWSGIDLTEGLLKTIHSAAAILAQLKDPAITELMGGDISTKLQKIEDQRNQMMAAIQGTAVGTIGIAQTDDGVRLLELTRASAFCEGVGISDHTIEDAIRETVAKVIEKVDAPLEKITSNPSIDPKQLTADIASLMKEVGAVAKSLAALPLERTEFLARTARALKDALEAVAPEFSDGDPHADMGNGLALMRVMEEAGGKLDQTGWPTDAMIGKVTVKLEPVVGAKFETHHPPDDLDQSTLDHIAAMRSELAKTSEILVGPNTPRIQAFVTKVVKAHEATATKAINLAEITIAIREVFNAAAQSANQPVDVALMQKCQKVLAAAGDASRLPNGHDMEALGRLVDIEVPKLTNLIGGDAVLSQSLRGLTTKLGNGTSADSIAGDLRLLKSSGSGDTPRTDAAMVAFLDAFNMSSRPSEDKVTIGKVLLHSNLVSAHQKDAAVAHLATSLSTQWEAELGRPGQGEASTDILNNQLQGIAQLGLAARSQVLIDAACAVAVTHIGTNVIDVNQLGSLADKLVHVRDTQALTGNALDVVNDFVKSVRASQSNALADAFTDLSTTSPPPMAVPRSMLPSFSFSRTTLPVGPTAMELSHHRAAGLAGIRQDLKDLSTEDSAGSLTSRVSAYCTTELASVDLETTPAQALETLYSVHMMMGAMNIQRTADELKTKIDEAVTYLREHNAVEFSLDHIKMFTELAGRSALQPTEIADARTKVVEGWGTAFAARATNANTKFNAAPAGRRAAVAASMTTVAAKLDTCRARDVMQEWTAFKIVATNEDKNVPVVAGIRSTMGFFQVQADKSKAAGDISRAIRLADGRPLSTEDVRHIVTTLKTDSELNAEDQRIPVQEKTKLERAVSEFFASLVASGPGSIDDTVAKATRNLEGTYFDRNFASTYRATMSELLGIRSLVLESAQFQGMENKSAAERVLPAGGHVTEVRTLNDQLTISIGEAIDRLDAAIAGTGGAGGMTTSDVFGRPVMRTIPTLDSTLQASKVSVADRREEIYGVEATAEISQFSAKSGPFDQQTFGQATELLIDRINPRVLVQVAPIIEVAIGDLISTLTPTTAPEILGTQVEVRAGLIAAKKAGVNVLGNVKTKTQDMFRTQIAAYFNGVNITAENITQADDPELGQVLTQLQALDGLVAVYGTTGDTILASRDTAKAPKLVALAAAQVLNAIHNIAQADGMKNLATVLRRDLTGSSLSKTTNQLYEDVTGTQGTVDDTPLNVKMATLAIVGDPDEHKLAVMTQALKSSGGAALDTLTVAALGTKLTAYVTGGAGLDAIEGPAMIQALTKLNTFLTTVGTGAGVQNLPPTVITKIVELADAALTAATAGGSRAQDAAWEGCRAQIVALKENLGISAAQDFGTLNNARLDQSTESILTADQRITRDEIVGLDQVGQQRGNAANISGRISSLLVRLNTQDNFTGVQKAQLKAVIAAALPKLQIEPTANLQDQANTIGAALTDLLSPVGTDVQPDNLAILKTDVVRKFDVAQQTRIAAVTFDGDDITSQDGSSLRDKKQTVEGFRLTDVGLLVLKDLGTAEIAEKLAGINKAQVLNILHLSEQLSEFATATQEHVAAAPALLGRLAAATDGRAVVTETVATIRRGLGLEPGMSNFPLQDAVHSENEKLQGLVALGGTLRNIEAGIGNATVIPQVQRSASLVTGALRDIANTALADAIDAAKLATLAHLLRSTDGVPIKLGDERPATYLHPQRFGEKLTGFIEQQGGTSAKLAALTELNTAIGGKLGELAGTVKSKLINQASAILDEVIHEQNPANSALVGTLGAQLETLGVTSKVAKAKLATWYVPAHAGSADWLTTQIANINGAYAGVTGGQTLKAGLALKVTVAIDAHLEDPVDAGKLSILLGQANNLHDDAGLSNLRIEVLKHLNTRAMAGILDPFATPEARAGLIKSLKFVGITGADIMAKLAEIATAAVAGDPDQHKLGIMAHVLRLSGGGPITAADGGGILTADIFKERLGRFITDGGADAAAMSGRLDDFVRDYIDPTHAQRVSDNVGEEIKSARGDIAMVGIREQSTPAGVAEALVYLQKSVTQVAAKLPADAKATIEATLRRIEVPVVGAEGGAAWLATQVAHLEAAYATALAVCRDLDTTTKDTFAGKVSGKMEAYILGDNRLDPARVAELNVGVLADTPGTGLGGDIATGLRAINVSVANFELTTLGGLATFEFKYGVALADVRDRLVQIASDASAGDSVDKLLTLAHVMRISGSTPIPIDGGDLSTEYLRAKSTAFTGHSTEAAGIRTLLIGEDGNGGLCSRLGEFPKSSRNLVLQAAGTAVRAVVLEPGSFQPNADALGEVVTKFAARGVDVGSLRTALIAKFEVELTRQIDLSVITPGHYAGGLEGLTDMRRTVEAIAPLTDVNGTLFSTAGTLSKMAKLSEIDEAIRLHAVVQGLPTPTGDPVTLRDEMRRVAGLGLDHQNVHVLAKLATIVNDANAGDTPDKLATLAHVLRLTRAADCGALTVATFGLLLDGAIAVVAPLAAKTAISQAIGDAAAYGSLPREVKDALSDRGITAAMV